LRFLPKYVPMLILSRKERKHNLRTHDFLSVQVKLTHIPHFQPDGVYNFS
jgi:hypothetical protein